MPSTLPLLHITMPPALLKRIEDFRFKHRFPSRAAAVKWLIDFALSQKPTPRGGER